MVLVSISDIEINVEIGEKTCEVNLCDWSIIFPKNSRFRQMRLTKNDFNYWSMLFSTLIFLGNNGSVTFSKDLNIVPKQLKSLFFNKLHFTNHILMSKNLHSFCTNVECYNSHYVFNFTCSKYLQKISTGCLEISCNKLPKYLHSANTRITAHDNGILPKYLRTCIFEVYLNCPVLMPKNLVKLKSAYVLGTNIRFPNRLKKMSIHLFGPISTHAKMYQTPEYLDTLIMRGYMRGVIENLPCVLKCLSIESHTNFDINELYSLPNNLSYIEVTNYYYEKLKPKYGNFTKQSSYLHNNCKHHTVYTKIKSV